MVGEVYQFQKFRLHIFHQDAFIEYVDISYTKLYSHVTTYEDP